MASPLMKHLKKGLSPSLMRLKSPFKLTPRSNKLHQTQQHTPTSPHHLTVPTLSYGLQQLSSSPRRSGPSLVQKRLFSEAGESTTSPALPSPDREPDLAQLLDRGVEALSSGLRLGRGSFGTVILTSLKGERRALKIVRTERRSGSTIRRELNGLILSHPNVIDVKQVVHNPKKPFAVVVMESWSPLTLQSLVDGTIDIPIQESLRLVRDVGLALEYCHEVGILHLDVKPKNILINLKERRSKLCDFGNSHNLFSISPYPSIQGTVAYTAPELFQGRTATESCDIYSLGITLWQVAHQEASPYPAVGSHAIIYQVVSKDLRPLTSKQHQQTERKDMIKLYEKCLKKDPKERPTASSLVATFNSMLGKY